MNTYQTDVLMAKLWAIYAECVKLKREKDPTAFTERSAEAIARSAEIVCARVNAAICRPVQDDETQQNPV